MDLPMKSEMKSEKTLVMKKMKKGVRLRLLKGTQISNW
jgi:hypothetical protein